MLKQTFISLILIGGVILCLIGGYYIAADLLTGRYHGFGILGGFCQFILPGLWLLASAQCLKSTDTKRQAVGVGMLLGLSIIVAFLFFY